MASWILMTTAQAEAATALDVPGSGVAFGAKKITSELANNIGQGTLVGGETDYWVEDVHALIDPTMTVYYALCSTYPIITVEPEVLFVPEIGL